MAWSWGASRMIVVVQQSGADVIDYQRLGVTGCSRLGESAFVIGLCDERIALTIPQEPSTGGDPALRIMDGLGGAERTDYNCNGLNWLSNNFAPFVYGNNTSNVVKLPIDTHSPIATFAPRGLLVLENPHQSQMGAPAGHLATITGAEVYKALGVEANVSYHSNVADTNHCSWKTECNDLLTRSLSRFLKHETAKTGDILVGAGGSLKTTDWQDWTAPTLQDDLPAHWVLVPCRANPRRLDHQESCAGRRTAPPNAGHLARIPHQPQSVDGGQRTACRPEQSHGGLDIVDGNPGRVPIPSRALATAGKAGLRRREC